MEIIKNNAVLKDFGKKYGMEFDKQYKYCVKEGKFKAENGYKLKYFSGCFYPYLVKEVI